VSRGKEKVTNSQHKEHVVAIPLMAEGLTTGVLVLASKHRSTASQKSFLQVAASMIALIIRNSQLCGQLESVERLLAREQWETAQEALAEMREGIT
jgi:transcriptional regulator with GAF, ATPase, and Fis domain